MKPSLRSHVAQLVFSAAFLFACPAVLAGQPNQKNKDNQAPPQKSAPAPPPQRPVQQPQPPIQKPPQPVQPPPQSPRGGGPSGPSAGGARGGGPTSPTGATSGATSKPTTTRTPPSAGSHVTVVPPKPPETFKPPAGGKVTPTPAGHTFLQDRTGKVTGVFTKSGTEAHFTSAGRVSLIKTATGTTITGSGVQRQVASQSTMKSGTPYRAMSTSVNSGYVERKLERGQGNLVQRTYVSKVNNVTVTDVRVYHTYSYR